MRTVIFWLILATPVFSQEPVEGPILDTIEKRITERFEAQGRLLDAIEARIEGKTERVFGELRAQIQEAKAERQTIIQSFREWNQERVGLMQRISDFSQEISKARMEFAPFKWIIDRATAVVWAIGGFVVSVLLLFLLIIAVLLRLYLWVRNVIVPKDLRAP